MSAFAQMQMHAVLGAPKAEGPRTRPRLRWPSSRREFTQPIPGVMSLGTGEEHDAAEEIREKDE